MDAIAVSVGFGVAVAWLSWEFTGWLSTGHEKSIEVVDAVHRWTLSALRRPAGQGSVHS
jgi:hypothetical protein